MTRDPQRTAEPPELGPPLGLSASRFELDGQQYALFCFELPSEDLPSTLTAAERSVAQLALRGYSNKDIARARSTSIHTVANQLRTIYDKLGVSGRPGLLRSCCRSRFHW